MKILVVEDDLQMVSLYREWLSSILSHYRFNEPVVVTILSSGIEAGNLLSDLDSPYDITILDQVLPGESGDRLYSKYVDRMGKVVISSSYIDRFKGDLKGEDTSDCLFLKKPFNLAVLGDSLKGILELKGGLFDGQSSNIESKKYSII